jgi:CBS domain-containing protein
MRIEEIMSENVYYCRPDDSLASCARQMWEHDCGSVPVCAGDDDNRVVGMITDRDICMCALHQGQPLSMLKVRDAMSRTLTACAPRDKVGDVEELMRAQQVRRVPVIDGDGGLCGIVSLADFAREASSGNGNPLGNGVSGSDVGEVLAAICEPGQRNSLSQPSAPVY